VWDKDPTEDLINHGYFHITQPGPLHAPVQAFSIHRDENLDLVLETQSADDSVSTSPNIPAGTIRIANERVELTNIGNVSAAFVGILTRSVSTSHDERGIPVKREVAKVQRIEGSMPGAGPALYTVDWLSNVSGHSLLLPDFVRTEAKTTTTRTFGSDGLVRVGNDETSSFGRSAVKLTVSGVELFLCVTGEKSDQLRPGYILYLRTPDADFRRKVRDCLSYALGIYLVHLGTTTYTSDWHTVEFSSISAYSMDMKAFRLVNLPPAPLHETWRDGVDARMLSCAVNGIFASYDDLKFGNLAWAYWHAQAATPHIAGVHFGAAIEALLRRYSERHPDSIPSKPIPDTQVWKSFSRQVAALIAELRVDDASKSLLMSSLGSFNRLPLKALLEKVAGHLGITLGNEELSAWKRRDDAAHGNDREPGDELNLIRDNKLLRILFNRLLLRMTNASDRYHDHYTIGHKVRKLEEPTS